jgi:small-conductance mechanosensitive channel
VSVKRFFLDMNPTLRGFLIILAITGVIVGLSLYSTLAALYLIARIAFFLAIAFFVFLVWRERRSDIASWSARAQVVFYSAAILIVVDLAVFFWRGISGPDALAFFVVLALAIFSMWRVWKDEHSYGL